MSVMKLYASDTSYDSTSGDSTSSDESDDSTSLDYKWLVDNIVDVEKEDYVGLYDTGIDGAAPEVDDNFLENDWAFDSFSTQGSAFHGKLKGNLNALNSLKLEYNSTDQLLLAKWKQEAKTVLRNVRKHHGQVSEPLDPFSAFTHALPRDYLLHFAKWLNESRDAGECHRVSFEQLVSFLKVELALRFYRCSASSSAITRFSELRAVDIDQHLAVRGFLTKADCPLSNQKTESGGFNASCSVDPILLNLQDTCSMHWKSLFFIPGTTCVSLEQDKLPYEGKCWEQFGMRTITTKSKIDKEKKMKRMKRMRQPTVHLAASTSTGFIMSMNIELVHSSVSEAVGKVVDDLVGNNTTFFFDRDYLDLAKDQDPERQTNVVQIFHQKGAKYLGTAKTTSSFPTFEDASNNDIEREVVVGGRVAVPMQGTRAVFAASNRSTKTTALMMRHGMGKVRVAKLVSNEPAFGLSNTWSYETRDGQDPSAPGGVQRLPHGQVPHDEPTGYKDIAAKALKEMESAIFLMTREQKSQDWFLARLFRISCTDTYASMKCATAVQYLNTPKMKRLHMFVKDIAQLSSQNTIKYCNGASLVSDDVQQDTRKDDVNGVQPTAGQRSESMSGRTSAHHGDSVDCGKPASSVSSSLDTRFRTTERSSLPSSSQSTSCSSNVVIVEESDSDTAEPTDPQVAFLQVMMKRWFFNPIGSLGVESQKKASMGCDLNRFISTMSPAHLKLNVVWRRHYGLIVNRKVPFAADSPESVCALAKATGDDGAMDFFGLVAVEFKTCTSADSIKKLRGRVEAHGTWVNCKAGEEGLRKAIPNGYYRTKVVHHAAVLGLSHTLLVYATPTAIEQAVLVEVTPMQRTRWLAFLEKLQNKYMQFAYGQIIASPPRLGKDRTQVYGYAREHHTVDQYLGLWKAHSDDVIANGTPPTATRILAKMASSWDNFMGNMDSARKVLNTSKPVYSSLKPSSLIWLTVLDYALYNAFRLWQTSILLKDIDTFDSFKALTKARTKLGTFNNFIFHVLEQLLPGRLAAKLPGLAQSIHESECAHTSSEQCLEATEAVGEARRPKKRRKVVRSGGSDMDKLRLSKELHHQEPVGGKGGRSVCVLCCRACEKNQTHKNGKSGKPLRAPRSSTKRCSVCKVCVCKQCWLIFHTAEDLPIPPCELGKM